MSQANYMSLWSHKPKVFSAIFLMLAVLLPQCGFSTPDDDWARALYQAKKYEIRIEKSGRLFKDESMSAYLNSIVEKLYPEYITEFEVKILYSADLEAFILANGSIYISLGLLAKAQSEAQIASVLAHEGAHYVHAHILNSKQNMKTIASAHEFYGMDYSRILISDYSIETEIEADETGMERLVRAGYDPKEAVKIFQLMEQHARELEFEEQQIFRTHPTLLERIRHFREITEGLTGRVNKEGFSEMVNPIRLHSLKLNLSKYRFKSVILDLEKNQQISQYPPSAWFYLGEAYRQRGKKLDAKKSENAYLEAIKRVPKFESSYAALGLLYIKQGKYDAANKAFNSYLEISPNGAMSKYVRKNNQYAQKLSKH